jgi:hypothetical protein
MEYRAASQATAAALYESVWQCQPDKLLSLAHEMSASLAGEMSAFKGAGETAGPEACTGILVLTRCDRRVVGQFPVSAFTRHWLGIRR